MAKSRKQLFEEQLNDLQKDIGNLNQKLLNTPVQPKNEQFNRTAISGKNALQRDSKVDSHSSNLQVSTENKDMSIERLRHDLHVASREKDDAEFRLEQSKLEIEQLRKGIQDYSRLKTSYEHLRHDYDSLRISLESSERIRKQQKELIALLQRSHAIAGTSNDTDSVTSTTSSVSRAINNSQISNGSSFAPSADDHYLSSRIGVNRDRLSSFGSGTVDSFPSFDIPQHHHRHSTNLPSNTTDKVDYYSHITHVKPHSTVKLSQRRKLKSSTNPTTTSTTTDRILSDHQHRHAATKSTAASSGDGSRTRKKVSKDKAKPSTTPSVSGQHNSSQYGTSLQPHQQTQQSLSYHNIIQQNPSLVPSSLLSVNDQRDTSTIQQSQYAYTPSHYTSGVSTTSYQYSGNERIHSSDGVTAGTHYQHQQQQQSSDPPHQRFYYSPHHTAAQYVLPSSAPTATGRPPRHPSVQTSSSGVKSSSKERQQPALIGHHSHTTRSTSAPPSPYRLDHLQQPPPAWDASPIAYQLPPYSDSQIIPTTGGGGSKRRSSGANSNKSLSAQANTSMRQRKVRSSRSVPSSPTSSARLINVPIPSPATSFGSASRRL